MKLFQYIPERLLCKNKGSLLCYFKGYLVLRSSIDRSFIQKIRINPLQKSNIFIERLFRVGPRVAIAIDNDTYLFSNQGVIYKYSIKNNDFHAEHYFSKGMNNPLAFCKRCDESGNILDVLYGEYIWNPNREAVDIYRRMNEKWDKVYTFQENTILHIHNIVYDKYKERYLILTGDSDNESAIWEADLNFTDVRKIVGGKQIYRACVTFPCSNHIYYPTDTPLEQNWFIKICDDGSVEKIYKMPGPCIYGIVKNDNFYMATSVEGDPTLGKWRYRLTNRLGKGVQDRYVHLIKCNLNGDVAEIGKIKKDILPVWLFQFGNALFPESDDERIYICPQSTIFRGTFIIDE